MIILDKFVTAHKHMVDLHDDYAPAEDILKSIRDKKAKEDKSREPLPNSCFFFDHDHPIRRRATDLEANPWTDHIVLAVIFASCVVMSFETPAIVKGSVEDGSQPPTRVAPCVQ
eukprot:COSAG05_NODE_1222_length_5472_cov_7.765033_3_plen_114_part_00